MIRRMYRRACERALRQQTRDLDDGSLSRSAVVFSPHYDDETLGVGGTIIRKRRLGAPVDLVFLTDGSRSHAHAMDGVRLSSIRKAEAVQAAAALGVPESRVTFLDLPEMRLAEHRAEAVARVCNVLGRLRCDEVYVPSTLEPLLWSADHNVTTEVVLEALDASGQRPEIFEYLVWFWYHWPWVPVALGGDTKRLLRLTWQNRFGRPARTGVNVAVPISDVIAQKQFALARHASQMIRLRNDTPWPVLGDVGRGEFLERFFQPYEFFKRYPLASLNVGRKHDCSRGEDGVSTNM